MKHGLQATRLAVAAFARDGAALDGRDSLADFDRLAAEASAPVDNRVVIWSAVGEWRAGAGRSGQPWLHLQARATLPMTCQRCLEPAAVDLVVDRWFRFVQGEDQAAALDEEAEEDVLALSGVLDLKELVEDELLMALPLVPMHEECPAEVKFAAADPGFDESLHAAENPFAVLKRLRSPRKS